MGSPITLCLAGIFLLGSISSVAQTPASDHALDSMDKLAADSLHNPSYKIGVESRFPGGSHAWAKYLSENLQYPKKAIRKKVEGIVVVQFIVEKDGTVTDVEAISGDPLLRDEAVRIVKASPAWIPARGDGVLMKSYKKQPIKFTLPN